MREPFRFGPLQPATDFPNEQPDRRSNDFTYLEEPEHRIFMDALYQFLRFCGRERKEELEIFAIP